MRLDKFTVKAQELLESAHEAARANSNQAIEAVHLLKAMIDRIRGL